MIFREHRLPFDTNYSSLDEVPDDAMQILDIYDAIEGGDGLYEASQVNRLLDEFEGQRCFVVEESEPEDDDLSVLAVANIREEHRAGHTWLEGLAVHSQERKRGLVGCFAINNLVDITRASGLHEIRLRSVPSAISFYQRNGFIVLDEDQSTGEVKMLREVR